MTEIKEPHYFAFDDFYRKGPLWYASLFAKGRTAKARGESSTGYMVFANALERIVRDVPEAKFVFVLRNPIDRAYSHYWWMRGLGFEHKSFQTALLRDMAEEPDPRKNLFGNFKFYYQYGLYGKWLSHYLSHFPLERLHVLTSSSLATAPLEAVNECFRFLGVAPLNAVKETIKNPTGRLICPPLYWTLLWLVGYSPIRRHILAKLPPGKLSSVSDRVLNWLYRARDTRFLRPFSYPKMDLNLREWTAQFYVKDVRILRNLTGYTFEEWTSDFPL